MKKTDRVLKFYDLFKLTLQTLRKLFRVKVCPAEARETCSMVGFIER